MKNLKSPQYLQPLEVIWMDHSQTPGWGKYQGNIGLMEIHTLGYFLDQDDECLVLTDSHCDSASQPHGNVRHIGKKLIVKVRKCD